MSLTETFAERMSLRNRSIKDLERLVSELSEYFPPQKDEENDFHFQQVEKYLLKKLEQMKMGGDL